MINKTCNAVSITSLMLIFTAYTSSNIFEKTRVQLQLLVSFATDLSTWTKSLNRVVNHRSQTVSPEVVCCQVCWGSHGAPCDTQR